MRCLGIAIKKNEICYAVVDGTQMNDAIVTEIGKQNYRVESETLMMDFSNIFLELLTKYKPDKVVYKLYLDANIQQIPYMHFSLGVLELLCLQNGIVFKARSDKWITAGKKAKIKRFESFFLNEKYKNEEIAAILIAWYELEA